MNTYPHMNENTAGSQQLHTHVSSLSPQGTHVRKVNVSDLALYATDPTKFVERKKTKINLTAIQEGNDFHGLKMHQNTMAKVIKKENNDPQFLRIQAKQQRDAAELEKLKACLAQQNNLKQQAEPDSPQLIDKNKTISFRHWILMLSILFGLLIFSLSI